MEDFNGAHLYFKKISVITMLSTVPKFRMLFRITISYRMPIKALPNVASLLPVHNHSSNFYPANCMSNVH